MIGILFVYALEGLICSIAGVPSLTEEMNTTISLFLLMINTCILFVYLAKRYECYTTFAYWAILISLALKVLLLLWDYYGASIFILPNSHADSESFHGWAVRYAVNGVDVNNYTLVVGLIYKYFGVQRITAQFLNIILSFVGIDMLDKCLDLIHVNDRNKDTALVLSALLPNYLIMSSILIRECIISVIICVSLFFFVKWWSEANPLYYVLALIVSFGCCYFHSGAIAVTIGYAVALVLTRRNEEGERVLSIGFSSVIVAVLFTIVFMYLFSRFSDSLLNRFGGLTAESVETYIDEHDFYGGEDVDSSKYYAGIPGLSGITGIIINSPIRMVYFLWVPMPWDIRGVNDIIAFLGNSLFYGGTVFAAVYSILFKRDEETDGSKVVVFLAIALCTAFVFAWGTESAGSALRHREKFYFIFLMLFATLSDYNHQYLEQRPKLEQSVRISKYLRWF